MSAPDRATFYGGGAEGYEDYPAYLPIAGSCAERLLDGSECEYTRRTPPAAAAAERPLETLDSLMT